MLGRSLGQLWTSMLLKRQIVSPAYLRCYEGGIRHSVEALLRAHGAAMYALSYDALIEQPERTIADLNEFLETQLTVADLEAVYHGALRRPTRGLRDVLKAWLIYLKNYAERQT